MQTIHESSLGRNNWVLFLQAVTVSQGLGCLWVNCASSRSSGTGGTGIAHRIAPLVRYWFCCWENRADLYSCDVCSSCGVSDYCPLCLSCLPIAPISASASSSGFSAPFELKWRSLTRSLQFKIIIKEGASGSELSLSLSLSLFFFFPVRMREVWLSCCYLVVGFFLSLGRCTETVSQYSIECLLLARSCAKCCFMHGLRKF